VSYLVTLGLDYATYCGTDAKLTNFTAELAAEVAQAVGVAQSAVAVINVYSGSIIADVAVNNPPASAANLIKSGGSSLMLLSHVTSVSVDSSAGGGDADGDNNAASSRAHMGAAAMGLLMAVTAMMH